MSNGLAANSVIAALVFTDGSGAAIGTNALASSSTSTVSLGTVNLSESSGIVEAATVVAASASGISPVTVTPQGLSPAVGTWVSTGSTTPTLTGTPCATHPQQNIVTIIQNADGSYTGTQLGFNNTGGGSSSTCYAVESRAMQSVKYVPNGGAASAPSIGPGITIVAGGGGSIVIGGVATTGGGTAATIGNIVFPNGYFQTTVQNNCAEISFSAVPSTTGAFGTAGGAAVSFTPYELLSNNGPNFLPACTGVAPFSNCCANGSPAQCYTPTGGSWQPMQACGGSTNCCNASNCYDPSGIAISSSTANLCGTGNPSNPGNAAPPGANELVSVYAINAAGTEIQDDGAFAGAFIDTTSGITDTAFGHSIGLSSGCLACFSSTFANQGGCVGVGTVNCGQVDSGNSTGSSVTGGNFQTAVSPTCSGTRSSNCGFIDVMTKQ